MFCLYSIYSDEFPIFLPDWYTSDNSGFKLNKFKYNTEQQPGQRELTSFPGTYVDDIKLIPCVEKKDGKYFPLGMYTIVKNGEEVGSINQQDLIEALKQDPSLHIQDNPFGQVVNKVNACTIAPAGSSVQAQFIRIVLRTVEENCDEETFTKVAKVYKEINEPSVDRNNEYLLTKVWELCGNQVMRILHNKLDKTNLIGCWLVGNPFITKSDWQAKHFYAPLNNKPPYGG